MEAQALENQGYRHTSLYPSTKIPTNNRIEKRISARIGSSSIHLSRFAPAGVRKQLSDKH
jgi:hypothetical protein